MVVVVRLDPARLRATASFLSSTCVHGALLAWVAFGTVPQREPNIYDMTIRPHESRIVWYRPSRKLPEIAPAEKSRETGPPRARLKFDQNLVAGRKDDRRPPQMIYAKAPEVSLPKPLPVPNMVAVVQPRPKPARPFLPPPPPPPRVTPLLPQAPEIKTNALLVKLPDGTAALRPKPRAFSPPPEAPRPQNPKLVIPATPEVAVAAPTVNLPTAMPKAPLRVFTARNTAPAAPAPPTLAADAPEATLAVAGINPVPATTLTVPPISHLPGFSAGPVPTPDTGASAPNPGAITVPGLQAQGGARDARPALVAAITPSRQNLIEGARAALRTAPMNPPPTAATRVTAAPDPRLEGRAVYTLAIQMPNVTSYTGSWIVWFAEHETVPGARAAEVRAPVPLRKVDPKYIASAADERVEGTVRLFAVIRRDGHVDSVSLIRHLDDRLDRSAQEALAKWQFEPALRNGTPVDIDAVFEIPFRLAPKPTK